MKSRRSACHNADPRHPQPDRIDCRQARRERGGIEPTLGQEQTGVTNDRGKGPRIAIIGAGPGGICMAIRLKLAGFDEFVILEKSAGLGGTWYRNRYPGCECDIPSHLYSFSFEIKADWSKPYAQQPEILAYMRHCADKYGLLPHCRFDDGVRRAVWNDETSHWTLEHESGRTIEADVVVSAIGMFNDIEDPEIEGLDSFARTRFHSAHWNWDHDLSGERVAVIGSAASAVQFVPEIVTQAGLVHLFQRTANWVLPKEDDPFSDDQLEYFRANPDVTEAMRREIFEGIDNGTAFTNAKVRAELEAEALAQIEAVEDPAVRAKLVPDHPWGCKRPLFSNFYYPAFNRPNLQLVTDPIDRITPTSVVTVDGTEREVDTLILATGFETTKYLSAIEVTGRDGLNIRDAWQDGAQAYMGITTAGFPNLFMLYGPNTNNGSIITMIEYQVDHALQHIQRIASENLAWVDIKPEPMATYNAKIQRDIEGIEPWQAGCNSYYRSPSGRVVTQWPHSMSTFKHQVETLDPDVYEVAPRGGNASD